MNPAAFTRIWEIPIDAYRCSLLHLNSHIDRCLNSVQTGPGDYIDQDWDSLGLHRSQTHKVQKYACKLERWVWDLQANRSCEICSKNFKACNCRIRIGVRSSRDFNRIPDNFDGIVNIRRVRVMDLKKCRAKLQEVEGRLFFALMSSNH